MKWIFWRLVMDNNFIAPFVDFLFSKFLWSSIHHNVVAEIVSRTVIKACWIFIILWLLVLLWGIELLDFLHIEQISLFIIVPIWEVIVIVVGGFRIVIKLSFCTSELLKICVIITIVSIRILILLILLIIINITFFSMVIPTIIRVYRRTLRVIGCRWAPLTRITILFHVLSRIFKIRIILANLISIGVEVLLWNVIIFEVVFGLILLRKIT